MLDRAHLDAMASRARAAAASAGSRDADSAK
jgi:hypothetical protein